MKIKTIKNIQAKIDTCIDKVFLRFIPHNVKPNHVTIVRFILIPVVYYLLASNNIGWGLVVFVIAASTDFIDGAMARTRDQITDIGKIIDPIADKLLILTVLLYVGFNYLIVKIFVFFIIFELLSIVFGSIFSFVVGKTIGANVFGKIKMILQSFSVGLFVLGLAIKSDLMISISESVLFVALFFAVLSALEMIRRRLNINLNDLFQSIKIEK